MDSGKLRAWLTKTSSLWILFGAFLAITLSFVFVSRTWDLVLIDGMSDPGEISAYLATLTAEQKSVHIWTTAIPDVLFPFIYGALFVGMALRFFGGLGPLIALPGLLTVPFDLTEGVVQVMALTGNESLLWMKAYVTPTKTFLFLLGFVATIAAAFVALKRRFIG